MGKLNKKFFLNSVEWETLFLILFCYSLWILILVFLMPGFESFILRIFGTIVLIYLVTLHSSLMHEVIHDHPTKLTWLNECLVGVNIGLLIPFKQFKKSHLDHHEVVHLTDPIKDPESYYFELEEWNNAGRFKRLFIFIRNTLIGRLFFEPIFYLIKFFSDQIFCLYKGNYLVKLGLLTHIIGIVPVLIILQFSSVFSIPNYLLFVCIPSTILLMLRTYIEHRLEADKAHQSVIVESGTIMSLMFLYNNYHAIHHAYPKLSWYLIKGCFEKDRNKWILKINNYYFLNYFEIFRKFSFKPPKWLERPVFDLK